MADCLVLLSDIDGLYDKNPAHHDDATHIPTITALTADIMAMGGEANQQIGLGSGGMATKLQAAKIAKKDYIQHAAHNINLIEILIGGGCRPLSSGS